MKTNSLIISFLITIFIISCNNKTSDKTSSNDSLKSAVEQIKSTEITSEVKKEEYLIIHGKDIWVRDVPTTGKVVIKLNEGDKCQILEKGKLESVKGRPDYWYKVNFYNNQGWVFGSQTDLMLLKPVNDAFTGNLVTCNDELVSTTETPPSLSYTFKEDKTFQFMVAAGFLIKGKYQMTGNILTLNVYKLTMDTPDGSKGSELKGTISFYVFTKDQIICLAEKENKLVDKDYAPLGGCFCLNN